MSDTGNKLRDFLNDLSNSEKLQDEYAKNPEKVMDKYCLSDKEKLWIKEGNTREINKHIGDNYISNNWIHVSKK